MENPYIIMLGILVILAIADLIVGVSNDAVNFLNSAVGSRAVSFRTILIVASIGIAVGAIFSSGMMEVARKGIFNPGEFYFDEIMIIFIAVMIADVLLLDFFNTLGLPTSTTVSIVFDLLGASVAIGLLKIFTEGAGSGIGDVFTYINTSKATMIIVAIFLSVALAFTVGVIVQYISRLIFTFQFKKKLKYFGAIFGGVALTAISFYIVFKGMKDMTFISDGVKDFISNNTLLIIGMNLVFWTLLAQMLMSVFKINILKVIIVVGTFALALAFAGNDLVNFIGVPIAAWQSLSFWSASGIAAPDFSMSVLSGEVHTPTIFLVIAGLIMVLALWFSSKARHVMDTELSLARQGEGKEKFKPTFLSRTIVRYSIAAGDAISVFLPTSVQETIERQFQKPKPVPKEKRIDAPMFDMVRASVNLVVASILISIGTNYQLPLSTTYVTFMVAMGTSLADRAWDRESAVYRVAGVFNVIGGWFLTAIGAFIGAGIIATLIWFGGIWMVLALAAGVAIMMISSALSHTRKMKKEKSKKRFTRKSILTAKEIMGRTSDNISSVLNGIIKRYGKVLKHLADQDLRKLKRDKKKITILEDEAEELKAEIFYILKTVKNGSVEAGEFYVLISDYLDQMVRSLSRIIRSSHKHVNNQHKSLKQFQVDDLKVISGELNDLFEQLHEIFDEYEFRDIERLREEIKDLLEEVYEMIHDHIRYIRESEDSARNTKLYFGLLLETKNLLESTKELLKLFQGYYMEARSEF